MILDMYVCIMNCNLKNKVKTITLIWLIVGGGEVGEGREGALNCRFKELNNKFDLSYSPLHS